MSEPKPATIKVTESGPLRVKGLVTVVDADGTTYQITRKTFFLCRLPCVLHRAVLRRRPRAHRLPSLGACPFGPAGGGMTSALPAVA